MAYMYTIYSLNRYVWLIKQKAYPFSSLSKYFFAFVTLIGLTSEDYIFQNYILTYIYSLSLA